MKKQPLPTRGGRRPGAGRKAAAVGNRVNVSFTLPPDVRDYLIWKGTDGGSRSVYVEHVIRQTAEFKRWSEENKSP